MANKKTDIKKNKKQIKEAVNTETKSSVEANLKDVFVADAQNTIFSEEDVKELENSKKVEEQIENTVKEEKVKPTKNIEKAVEKKSESKKNADFKVNESEMADEQTVEVEITSEDNVKEENIPLGTETIEEKKEDEIITAEVTKKGESPKKTVKKRITTKEAYGYHWMGLIYDE